MKKGIIVVSFGTTYEETRRLNIEAIENRVKEEYSETLVLRAFTSEIIRKKLKIRDKLSIFNVKEALEQMKEENIKYIYLQPLHIIEGHEYEKVLRQARDFLVENRDINIKIGRPLLSAEEDYINVVEALELRDQEGQALVYMGHGSDHDADRSYEKLETRIRQKGIENTFIGTVEGSRTIDQIVEELKAGQIERVELKPFMLVAGDHAINDMASDEEDSWKSILEGEGILVETELKGLGENEGIQEIFINHLEGIYK